MRKTHTECVYMPHLNSDTYTYALTTFVINNNNWYIHPHHTTYMEDVDIIAAFYDDDIEVALSEVRKHRKDTLHRLCPNELNVATFTIMGHLTLKHINLLKIVRSFRNKDVVELLEQHGIPVNLQELDHSDEMAIHVNAKKKKQKKTFQNSVIFKYSQPNLRRNNKAVKIFCNGSLHVNGCKSVGEFLEVCNIVCDMLNLMYTDLREIRNGANRGEEEEKWAEKEKTENEEGYDKYPVFALEKFDVQLINTNFVVPHKFDLPKLRDLIEERSGIDADLDVAFHPAINLKYQVDDREVTILVFNSGSIIITGVVKSNELLDSYKFITNFLEEHLSAVVVREINVKGSEDGKRNKTKRSKTRKGGDDEEDGGGEEGEEEISLAIGTKRRRCEGQRGGRGRGRGRGRHVKMTMMKDMIVFK